MATKTATKKRGGFAGAVDTVVDRAKKAAAKNGKANGKQEDGIRFSEHDCETILHARQALKDRKAAEADAKVDLREARAAREKATEALERAIDEARQPNLFNRPPAAESSANGNGHAGPDANGDAKPAAAAAPVESPAKPVELDPSWRLVGLDVLSLADTIREKLIAGGVMTLSELQALKDSTDASRKLTNIDGIGAAAASKIEESLAEFWAKHGLKGPPAAAPAEASAPVDQAAEEVKPSEAPAEKKTRGKRKKGGSK